MRSRRRLAGAVVALAGMLFLQAAVALAPCETPGRSAALARAAAMAAMPQCPESDQASLCLAHCASEDQTILKVALELPQLVVPAAPVPAFPANLPTAEKPAPHLAAAGPPPRILFQSFLL